MPYKGQPSPDGRHTFNGSTWVPAGEYGAQAIGTAPVKRYGMPAPGALGGRYFPPPPGVGYRAPRLRPAPPGAPPGFVPGTEPGPLPGGTRRVVLPPTKGRPLGEVGLVPDGYEGIFIVPG